MLIYLDNAATSLRKPPEVYDTLDKFTRRHSANAGRGVSKESMTAVDAIISTQNDAARLFNISESCNIAFMQNATYALNTAILGTLSDGGHAVTTVMDHNSVLRPLHRLGNYTAVKADKNGFVSPYDVERAIREDTKMIIISHASNVCGTIQDIRTIAGIAHLHKVKLMIDTAQTAGIVGIDNAELDADFIAFSGHKGLMGPLGTGGLYVKSPQELEPVITGGTGSESEELAQPRTMPDMLHSGTINAPAIAALGEGIRFVMKTGTDEILKHERYLAGLLRSELMNMDNVTVYGSEEGIGTVAFNINGCGSEETAERLSGFALRAGYHCAPLAHKALGTDKTGAVRASFGIYNTAEEARALAEAVNKIRNK
ncbi:MAG: aminotransferase class V-fold PLP-dependent enzyme [Clostridia bacterium]|nr:aminotransferase class V-fold PLP-dependent enzyme [Clostridia bacterium]